MLGVGFRWRACDTPAETPSAPACGELASDRKAAAAQARLAARLVSEDESSRLARAINGLVWQHVRSDITPIIVELRALAVGEYRERAAIALGAAYLIRGERFGQPADVYRSLELFESLAREFPDVPSIAFNLALVRDRLGLSQSAAEAWSYSVSLGLPSGWSDEATARVSTLPPDADLAPVRRAEVPNAEDVGRLLSATRADGVFTAGENGEVEPSLLDDEMQLWLAAGEARRASLAAGYEALQEALKAVQVLDLRDGTEPAAHAWRVLYQADSGLAGLAAWARARLLFAAGDHGGAADLVAQGIDAERNPLVRSQLLSLQALLGALEGDLDGAALSYEAAVLAARSGGSPSMAGEVSIRLAEVQARRGNRRSAWARLRDASLDRMQLSAANRIALDFVAQDQALAQRWLNVAGQFATRAVEEASGRPDLRAHEIYARIGLATIVSEQGEEQRAPRILQPAVEATRSFDPAVRAQLASDLDIGLARALARTEPERALLAARRARSSGGAALRTRAGELAKAEALATWQLGDSAGAAAALLAGIETVHAEAASISSRGDRIGPLRRARELVDLLVRFSSLDPSIGDAARRAVLEQRRLRASGIFGRIDADERRDAPAIPEDTAVVGFWAIEDRTRAYVWTSGVSASRDLPTGNRDWSGRAATLAAAVGRNDSAALQRLGRQLYDELIEPIADLLLDAERLVVVPDQALRDIPLGALEAADGQVLGDAVQIVFAPDETTAFNYLARIEGTGRGEYDVLGVAPTTLGTAHHSTLGPLPLATAEVEDIVRLYSRGTALTGSQASRDAFERQVNQFAVLHFAGHALRASEEIPIARLVMADSGEVAADRISEWQLARQPLVFLAACNAANEFIGGESGLVDLVPAFLSAGASAVVASPWLVDAEIAGRFARSFHGSLARTGDPVAALATAQRSMTGDDVPTRWAASAFGVHLGRANVLPRP